MKNPIKSINKAVRSAGRGILQRVHDKSHYILTTDKATRKANRKAAKADKKAKKAAGSAQAKEQAQEKQASRVRRFMNWAGSARPLWFLNREQAKA